MGDETPPLATGFPKNFPPRTGIPQEFSSPHWDSPRIFLPAHVKRRQNLANPSTWTTLSSTLLVWGIVSSRKLAEIEEYLTHKYYPFILEEVCDFYSKMKVICVGKRIAELSVVPVKQYVRAAL